MTNTDFRKDEPFRRPVPSFGDPTSRPVDKSKLASDDDQPKAERNGMQRHVPVSTNQHGAIAHPPAPADVDPYEVYPLSVKDIRSKLFGLGISKSKDSIQRYCREGMLDCVKLGMLRRYYVTEASVDTLIETLQNDEASSGGMQLHEAERSGSEEQLLLHGPATDENMATNKDLHEAASGSMQPDAAARNG
ncbi:MAG: helix-turn-helix domain-containing protein, partial [Rhizobiaceae bacterium]